MRVAFYTLGCKVNQYETMALLEQFVANGFEVVDNQDESDVYVLNSCTVTAESDKKTRQLIRRFRRQNPASVVALCGCFPQAFPDAAEKLPEADVILGASNKKDLLSFVKSRLAGGERVVNIKSYQKDEAFEALEISSFNVQTRAFVKIQDGCQRYCAYCIIPSARGPVRSKPLLDLKNELESLGESGHKEIVLVGINLSCYGQDIGLNLLDAVNLACSVDGIERVRLGSLEPELLEPQLIKKLAEQPKFCPQFHLSLQSAATQPLKECAATMTLTNIAGIVSDLRNAFPDAAITTDIMVGFPGETLEEFEQSLDFAREIGFARVHVFAYSRRSGTLSDKMENQIPQAEKHRRSKEMIAVTDLTRKLFLQQQVGKIVPVLFEAKEGDFWPGYTPNYTQVMVESNKILYKNIYDVTIEYVTEEHCIGKLVKAL